ncbi:MAG TPA: PTS sugar transporter subunit IIA [Gemmatirosa sp.]|nr:PTS sugar transporter subunit IIA [Gemmatirosa sp.]
MLLTDLLAPERVRLPLVSTSKDALLRELVALAVADRGPDVVTAVLRSVQERERDLTTGIGGGLAIPHGRSAHVESLVMAAGVCDPPVEYDALDGAPVTLCFLLVGPESAAGAHVRALARISRLLRDDAVRDALLHAPTPAAFLEAVRASEAATV